MCREGEGARERERGSEGEGARERGSEGEGWRAGEREGVEAYSARTSAVEDEALMQAANARQGAALVFAGDLLSQSFLKWMDGVREMRLDWVRLAKAGVVVLE